MLNFILCDDNINTLNRLSKMLESIFLKHDIDAQIGLKSTSPKEILEYVKNEKVNVVILDINLNSDINGCDVADLIRKNNKDVYIIFSTGHLEYVLLAYKYKTFDYLPKPIVDSRLEETVLRLIEDMKSVPSKFIKLNNNKTVIKEDEINFIKKNGMKLIFCTSNRDYEIYGSFNKIESCLPDNFVRCHKSFIANIDNIVNLDPKENLIVFNNNSSCSIGAKFKDDFMEVIKNGNITKNMDSYNNRK